MIIGDAKNEEVITITGGGLMYPCIETTQDGFTVTVFATRGDNPFYKIQITNDKTGSTFCLGYRNVKEACEIVNNPSLTIQKFRASETV